MRQLKHLADEDLESYSMGKRLLGSKLGEIEEHLSGCELCRTRWEEIEAHVATRKSTQRLLGARGRQ